MGAELEPVSVDSWSHGSNGSRESGCSWREMRSRGFCKMCDVAACYAVGNYLLKRKKVMPQR